MIEIDLDFLDSFEPRSRERATRFVAGLARFMIGLGPDTPRRIEGATVPDEPVILATNHTHVLDFVPLWIELLEGDEHMVGLVKAKMYKSVRNRALMRVLGNNLPIVSRGYLIAADFRAVIGRRPQNDEYRHLRDHLDRGEALPRGSPYDEITTTGRNMLGRPFHPSHESYRAAMCDLYYRMMQHMVDDARVYVEQGYHIHMYPEGQVSRRLGEGHTGVVHLAIALELPIVPVGISGTREAFVANTPLTRGGEFDIRVGDPMRVPPQTVPADFRPFHPVDQHRNEGALQAVADEVMECLNGLVAPEYGFVRRRSVTTTKGVDRFY